jgi:hypothetical protein
MQYLLLLYEDESVYGPDKTGPAMRDIGARHMAFRKAIGAARLGGAALQCASTTVSVRTGAGGAKTVHDGPYAETKEQLGGYYLIEAPDLDAAIEIARQAPTHAEGVWEVRPLWSPA